MGQQDSDPCKFTFSDSQDDRLLEYRLILIFQTKPLARSPVDPNR